MPKSTMSCQIIGVIQTSDLRPVNVSRNFDRAARVEEPVATTSSRGK